ncbi:MAG TPA: ATP-binding protein [Gemmatimonadales bacterium]|jgi:two-component system heavy metal sensor histidine kinase CusS
MPSSLGRTLAVRFGITMGVTLTAIALLAHAGMIRILRDQLDGSLRTTYEIRSGALAVRGVILPLPNISEGELVEQTNRVVAGWDTPLEAAGRQVLVQMLAAAVLGALASFVGASWLTRAALEPVGAIARQAGEIQAGRLGQRITVHSEVIELRGLIQVLNQMLARLERSHEWHRQIIRDLGHDLRTPIATIRAAAEMALSTDRKPDQYREVLASTLDETERLTLITDALRLLAKLEAGDLQPELWETDVRTIVGNAVDRARERQGGESIRFTPPAEPVTARVDARLLGMSVDQLLDNARRHTPAGTRVDVTVAVDNGHVRVGVEDEGPGVPDEMLPRLFNHFFRGDPARGREAGLGLGLTMVAAVADLHHGRVTAERGSPQGLRIALEFPRGELFPQGIDEHESQAQQDPPGSRP